MGHIHDDGTYCEHDHGDEESIITLEFDDGEEVDCDFIGTFDVDDKEYAILVPLDEELDEVYFYEYKETGDEFELIAIEDDAVFDKVAAEFESILEAEEALDGEDEE